MLLGLLTPRRVARLAPIAGLGLAVAHCGGVGDESPTDVSSAAIVGGTIVDDASSPVLLLRQPQGLCTGVLIAPNLVATVRHCVSPLTEGSFSCTPEGGLVLSGSAAGQLGALYAADQITFLKSTSVSSEDFATAPADGTGAQIVSTTASTVCSDDLAFVVLASPILGLTPLAVRLAQTEVGESVSVWGFGFTQQPEDPTLLRVASATLTAIGPSTPTTLAQGAPLRAARVGPGTVTCNGDSGAPVTSNATGALISLVSLGPVASTTLSCPVDGNASSTGPLLSDYSSLVLSAFAAAGVSPNLEEGDAMAPPPPPSGDATDATDDASAGAQSARGGDNTPEGSSCAAGVASSRGVSAEGLWSVAAACAAVAARRRRR